MNLSKVGALLLPLACVLAACAESPRPAIKAADLARDQQCGDTSSEGLALVRSTTVIRIEPIYSRVPTSGRTEARVNGAKMLVRPPRGLTAEQMTRVLQCHTASVLLGKVDPSSVPNDPYWLPDTWVDIQVVPERGNFAVTVSADTVRDNLRLLGRANRYGESQIATEPPIQ